MEYLKTGALALTAFKGCDYMRGKVKRKVLREAFYGTCAFAFVLGAALVLCGRQEGFDLIKHSALPAIFAYIAKTQFQMGFKPFVIGTVYVLCETLDVIMVKIICARKKADMQKKND